MKSNKNKSVRIIETGLRSETPIKVKNTSRIERLLNLIIFLNEYRTINEIAQHLKINKRSVNRYLNLLVQLGFTVKRGHSQNGHTVHKLVLIKEYFTKSKKTE